MWTKLRRAGSLLGLMLCLHAPLALHAEELDEEDLDLVDAVVRKPDPAEQAALREILLTPAPAAADEDALIAHYARLTRAALLLGDEEANLRILREAATRTQGPRFKNDLAVELARRESFAESRQWRDEAIRVANKPASRMFHIGNLARELFAQGKDEETEAALQWAEQVGSQLRGKRLTVYQQRNYLRAQGKVLRIRASLAARQGRPEEANRLALASLVPYRDAVRTLSADPKADPKNVLQSWHELASTLRFSARRLDLSGRSYEAGKLLTEALGVARDQAMPPDIVGRLDRAVGLHRLQVRQFADALAVLDRNRGNDDEGDAGDNLLSLQIACLIGLGRWQEAAARMQVSFSDPGFRPKNGNDSLGTIAPALVLLHGGQHARAREILAPRLAQALRRYGEHHFLTAELRGLHAVALWRSGDATRREEALRELRGALDDFALPANSGHFRDLGIQRETRLTIVESYLDAVSQAAPDQAVAAIAYADWLRSSRVGEAIDDLAARARIDDAELAAMVRREQDARNEIRGLREYLDGIAPGKMVEVAERMQARIATLEALRLGLQAKIRQRAPAFEQLARPGLPAPGEIARRLGPDQVVLAYLPTRDALFAWLIRRDGAPVFRRVAVSGSRLEQIVARLRAGLEFTRADRLPDFDLGRARELGEILLQPFAAELEGKSQLIVSASGALARIPFGLLLTAPPAGAGDFAQQPWLIRQAAITHTPSVSAWLALATQRAARPAVPGLIAWGDPLFAPSAPLAPGAATRALLRRAGAADPDNPAVIRYADIPPLPETRDELFAIADLLRARRDADVITGAAATRESVLEASGSGRLAGRSIVVFATHGLMAGDLPELDQPALAMAANGREGEDPLAPLLKLEDVLGLKLAADWVVLSACNTAAADGRAEEALSGLARGFFYAGTRSLLVTHWAVETESARALTTGTFANYALGRGKAASLREAMLALMQRPQFAHPVFWAPYALIGDGS